MAPNTPMEGAVPSPLTPQFDYNEFRDKTSIPAMLEILKVVADEGPTLVFKGQMQKKDIDDAYDKVASKVMEVLIRNNVVETNTNNLFQYLQSIFYIIADNLAKQVQGHKREIISRVVGVRNPGSNKFDIDYTNMGDLMAALLETRKNTGDKVEDYFFITPSVIPPMDENLPTNDEDNG